MGGGSHGHGHPSVRIPDASIYKVDDVPALKALQERLAKKGLKDPWIRNEVWKYHPGYGGTTGQRWIKFATRGMKVGIPAFLLTIAVEHYFGVYPIGHSSHDSHESHDGH